MAQIVREYLARLDAGALAQRLHIAPDVGAVERFSRPCSSHLYRVEECARTNDTQENRFLKFALSQITKKYETLKKRIEVIKNASDVMKEDMQVTLATLRHLQQNPFFRTVGNYKGLSQESLVLQKATGYSQVYRTWSLLQRSYSLNDGIYRLQTKDRSEERRVGKECRL